MNLDLARWPFGMTQRSGEALDIDGVPDPEHVPWIDPTHPA